MILPAALSAAQAYAPVPGLPVVRQAVAADDAFIDDLHAIAFGPGRFARTAFRVRERHAIDPSLSLVAESDGTACGSVWMTPISIGGINGWMLGPLATHPDFRKRGAGKLLAREVTRRAMERGDGRFVVLIGDQDYYCPLGYTPTTPGNIIWPGPVDPSRVLLHSDDPLLAIRIAGPVSAWGAGQQD